MKSLRRSYWYISLYFKRHARYILGATIFGVLLFAVILPILTRLPQVKTTRYIGVVGIYDFASLPREMQELMSRGLTKVNADGSVSPDLAERWTVEDNGKTYRFLLRKNIRWQDGKLLEPKDISFNFQDTQIIVNENEIIFKLKDPFSPFPTVMSQPILREVRASYLRFFMRNKIVGLGDYQITKTKYQDNRLEEIILDSVHDRLIYRFYVTEEKAKTAFQHGQVDTLIDISDISDFDTWKNISKTQTVHYDQYLAVFFNLNDPLFQKNIRQSLNYALEKTEGEERAKGPLNPKSWAYLDGVKSYEFDQARASERLIDELPQQPLHFTLTTIPRFQNDAERIKGQWEVFGQQAVLDCQKNSAVKEKTLCDNLAVQVNLSITNFPDTNSYQALLVGQSIPSDPDQYFFWHSTQNTNITHYSNPRIDVLLENGRKTTDQTERKAIYQEFQQFLLEDSPAVFMRHITGHMVER